MTTMKANVNEFETVALAQGRLFSLDTCQHTIDQTVYQYARVKRTPLMAQDLPDDKNFSAIYVMLSSDFLMNFVFMVKKATYAGQTDDQIINTIKVSTSINNRIDLLFLQGLNQENFT